MKIKINSIILLVTCLSLFPYLSLGNMANPYQAGTFVGSILATEDVAILREDLNVIIDPKEYVATFYVTYEILIEESDKILPLAFVARGYERNHFSVTVDGKTVPTYKVGKMIEKEKFDKEFESYIIDSNGAKGQIYKSFVYDNYSEVEYFELQLPKGKHLVQVIYKAFNYTYDRNPGYSFINYEDDIERYYLYNMSPAKLWKSFQNLKISIAIADPDYYIWTNLGPEDTFIADTRTYQWSYDKIPVGTLKINVEPISRKLDSSESINPYWAFIKKNVFWVISGLLLIIFVVNRFLKRK